jgi:hypothetical protein
MLVAEYTKAPKGQADWLDFNTIENGRRLHLESIAVAGKRQARSLAAQRGAKCWNF